MFRAIVRYFKALGYLLTGRIDSARKVLETNPHVVRATYDEIIRDKTGRISEYKKAVASLIAQQERKMQQVKALTDDVQKLERLKLGAAAKARQRVSELQAQGKTKEAIQRDDDYLKCQAAFNDFSSTLTEKSERITGLESDIGEYGKRITEHKVQLQHLLREVDGIKAEAADAVADMITSKEETELADLLTGLSQDGTNRELQRMRDLRREVKAEARISKEMAGTDTRAQEAEFLDYARSSASNDEFESLIGLSEQKDTAAREAEHDAPARELPE